MDYGFFKFFTYGATFLLAVISGVLALKSKKPSDICIFVGFLVLSISTLTTQFYYNALILNAKPYFESIEKSLKYSDLVMLSRVIALFFLVLGYGIKLMKG